MKISIDMTESDLQDLMEGETFDWTYTSDTGEEVEVHLYNEDNVRE
jgi:hypothetical protein